MKRRRRARRRRFNERCHHTSRSRGGRTVDWLIGRDSQGARAAKSRSPPSPREHRADHAEWCRNGGRPPDHDAADCAARRGCARQFPVRSNRPCVVPIATGAPPATSVCSSIGAGSRSEDRAVCLAKAGDTTDALTPTWAWSHTDWGMTRPDCGARRGCAPSVPPCEGDRPCRAHHHGSTDADIGVFF